MASGPWRRRAARLSCAPAAFGLLMMQISVFGSTFGARAAARAALLVSLLAAFAGTRTAAAFGFDDVAGIARKQARAPYKAPDRKEPAELAALNYDQYRDIRFRPDHALWRSDGVPFEVMFFHEGKENVRVRMDEVVGGKAAPHPVLERRLQLRQEHAVAGEMGRPRFRRLPRALPAERGCVQGRGGRVPRRELLPRSVRRRALWAVGSRSRGRYRRGQRARSFRTSSSSGS